MKYNFSEDLKSIREILNLSQRELAEQIGVEQVTIFRNESEQTEPSAKILESVYAFFRSIKDYDPDSDIKLQKLGLASKSSIANSDMEELNTDSIDVKLANITEIVKDSNLNYVENVRDVVEVIRTQVENNLIQIQKENSNNGNINYSHCFYYIKSYKKRY